MIVWLWDVEGPTRRGRGITDDQARALRIAETYLRGGQANTARVEKAVLVPGIRTLTSGYQRTGDGWRSRRGDSDVRWEPFAPASQAPSGLRCQHHRDQLDVDGLPVLR